MRFHRSLRFSHDDAELLQLERQKGEWFIGETNGCRQWQVFRVETKESSIALENKEPCSYLVNA